VKGSVKCANSSESQNELEIVRWSYLKSPRVSCCISFVTHIQYISYPAVSIPTSSKLESVFFVSSYFTSILTLVLLHLTSTSIKWNQPSRFITSATSSTAPPRPHVGVLRFETILLSLTTMAESASTFRNGRTFSMNPSTPPAWPVLTSTKSLPSSSTSHLRTISPWLPQSSLFKLLFPSFDAEETSLEM